MVNPFLAIGVIVLIVFNVSHLLSSNRSFSAESFSKLFSHYNSSETNVEKTLADMNELLLQNKMELVQIEDRLKNSGSGNSVSSSPSFEELFKQATEYANGQVGIRKQILKSIAKDGEFYLLYGSLAAEVFCPNKIRIGTMGDGGKWVCDPWKIPENCVMLSLGLNNHVTFETEIQKMISNRCQLFGYDSAEQSNYTQSLYGTIRGKSMKALISNYSKPENATYTISDLAKKENLKSIEILKIDIEGAEHTTLIPFLKEYKVCQIYIEVHNGAPEHAKLLNSMGLLDYRLFSYEVNGFSIKACEYSLIHESCIDKYGGKRIANYLNY